MDPLSLNIDRPRVIYRQISEQIRQLILSEQLEPGSRLPSSTELASRWNAHPATIHAALVPLVKEGLLTRRPKIGTFVSKRRPRLTNIGVYYDSNIWLDDAGAFKRFVHHALAQLLESKKITLTGWFDPRPLKKRRHSWDALTSAIERREIQALIATDVPHDVIDWIQPLPVITSFFTHYPVPNRVQLDFEAFAAKSVQLLKKEGCRSAGLISILEPTVPASVNSNENFYQRFQSLCAQEGIEVREEWIRMASDYVRDESQAEFGYNNFREIWRRSERPDGLVVYPDTSVPGVIMAVLEQRVNVPSDLKIVAHRNSEISFLCPMPISFLFNSTVEIAHALFKQVERQFNGETCQPIVVPFRTSQRSMK